MNRDQRVLSVLLEQNVDSARYILSNITVHIFAVLGVAQSVITL